MQPITHQNQSNDRETNKVFVHHQLLSDWYLEDHIDAGTQAQQVEIPCTITCCKNGITIAVEGYEDNMSIHLEYYDSKLQVFVWGEESLEREGDCDLKYIITDNYRDFCRRIDELYRE